MKNKKKIMEVAAQDKGKKSSKQALKAKFEDTQDVQKMEEQGKIVPKKATYHSSYVQECKGKLNNKLAEEFLDVDIFGVGMWQVMWCPACVRVDVC